MAAVAIDVTSAAVTATSSAVEAAAAGGGIWIQSLRSVDPGLPCRSWYWEEASEKLTRLPASAVAERLMLLLPAEGGSSAGEARREALPVKNEPCTLCGHAAGGSGLVGEHSPLGPNP